MDPNRLNGKNILITGAARGMGAANAESFAAQGANVCIGDLDGDEAQKMAEKINAAGNGKAIAVTMDVTLRQDNSAAVAATVEAFGSINVGLFNAGLNKPRFFMDIDEDNWDMIMNVNTKAMWLGMQETARQMIAQGAGGKIVNTASIASRQGYDNVAPYCASKWAVVSLTQSAARDLAKHDITVTGFAPGVVATEMWEEVDRDLMAIGASERPGQAMEEFSTAILKGRVAQPADITGTTTFLASADSDYMTGQIVMIDGGMTLI